MKNRSYIALALALAATILGCEMRLVDQIGPVTPRFTATIEPVAFNRYHVRLSWQGYRGVRLWKAEQKRRNVNDSVSFVSAYRELEVPAGESEWRDENVQGQQSPFDTNDGIYFYKLTDASGTIEVAQTKAHVLKDSQFPAAALESLVNRYFITGSHVIQDRHHQSANLIVASDDAHVQLVARANGACGVFRLEAERMSGTLRISYADQKCRGDNGEAAGPEIEIDIKEAAADSVILDPEPSAEALQSGRIRVRLSGRAKYATP